MVCGCMGVWVGVGVLVYGEWVSVWVWVYGVWVGGCMLCGCVGMGFRDWHVF